ncbi:MAG: hypothetical protein JW699_03320 [Chitinispirillaceae bacterium]|nr:hypothetical protein [Chitinispirillaceae bacterium]
MSFTIRMGVPAMQSYWDDLYQKAQENKLDKEETKLWKKLAKTVLFLSSNPRHNSLQSHEVDDLTRRYSKFIGRPCKVWQSYLENNTPAAGRLFWVYGPGKAEITVIGLEPHPEDTKKAGYAKVNLSTLPYLS